MIGICPVFIIGTVEMGQQINTKQSLASIKMCFSQRHWENADFKHASNNVRPIVFLFHLVALFVAAAPGHFRHAW